METPAGVTTKLEASMKLAGKLLPQSLWIQVEWVCNAFRGPLDHLLTMKDINRWAAVFIWYVVQRNGLAVHIDNLLFEANISKAAFAEEYEKLVLYQKAALDHMVTSNLSNDSTSVAADILQSGVSTTIGISTRTNRIDDNDSCCQLVSEEDSALNKGNILEAWQDAIDSSVEKICERRQDVRVVMDRVKVAAKVHSKKVYDVDILENRHFRSSSIAAVCIYFATRDCQLKVTQKVVANACGTSEVTLRKLQKKLITSNTMWAPKKVNGNGTGKKS